MAFYWINSDDELVTCYSKSDEPSINSDDLNIIKVEFLMALKYGKDAKHVAKLIGDYWEGMKSGSNDYPAKGRNSSYFIAGGNEDSAMFRPESIKIYAVNYEVWYETIMKGKKVWI